MAEKRHPERTCIGCRGQFSKSDVVRIVSAPGGAVIDYREKLAGRAAYVCPRRDCITRALGKDTLKRALRADESVPSRDQFLVMLETAVMEKIRSLVAMAAKSGNLAAGYSAVRDGVEKGSLVMLIAAQDLSAGTLEKIGPGAQSVHQATLFTKEQLGAMLGREEVGIIGIRAKRLADAIGNELKRLKDLLNTGQ